MSTVFRNAAVFDGHTHLGPVGDVVVDEGRVVAVGVDATTKGHRVVDVAGGLLLPGFTDAHVHPVQGGLERLACDLTGQPAESGAYLDHVRAYAVAHPGLAWIRGGGWAMAAFPGGLPTARELDTQVIARATLVCCDSLEDARLESGDLIEPIAAGQLDWLEVQELHSIVAGELPGRQSDDDIVVFKSNGLAAWDVALGHEVVRRASEQGVGVEL